MINENLLRLRRKLIKNGTYFESELEETGKDGRCLAATEADGRVPNEREAPRRAATRTERARKPLEALHEARNMVFWRAHHEMLVLVDQGLRELAHDCALRSLARGVEVDMSITSQGIPSFLR